MTVAQEQVREFLSDLPAAAFPMSNQMLAYLAEAQEAPNGAVAVLYDELPEGHYRSPKQVLDAISKNRPHRRRPQARG